MTPFDILSRPFQTGSWVMILFFGIAIFLLLREVATWYWKINRMISLLEEIEENTRVKGGALPNNKDLI